MFDGIVFIHAFPLDGSMWADQLEQFGKRTKVLAPSLPGFGGAPPTGEVMTMSAAADQVARAMHEATMSRAVVCGLSMGGYVALALWRQYPELVDGFVFANTKANADDESAKERRRQLAARLRAEGSGFLVESPPPLLSNEAPAGLLERVKRFIAAQPAEAITLGEVVRTMEPGLRLAECGNCVLRSDCFTSSVLAEALAAFLTVLDATTLAQAAQSHGPAFAPWVGDRALR